MISIRISFGLSSIHSEPLLNKSQTVDETLPRVRQFLHLSRRSRFDCFTFYCANGERPNGYSDHVAQCKRRCPRFRSNGRGLLRRLNRTIEQVGSYLGKPFSESNTTPDGRAPRAILSSMLTAFSVTRDVARRLVPSAEAQRAKRKGQGERRRKV